MMVRNTVEDVKLCITYSKPETLMKDSNEEADL